MTAPPSLTLAPSPGPGPGYQTKTHRAEVCPDVLAVAAEFGITRDRDLARLQDLYDRTMASADADFDFGTFVLARTRGRRGSAPVDSRVGERVARRLT